LENQVDGTAKVHSESDTAVAVATRQTESFSKDWLVGGGRMAKAIKAMDWSKTALGSMDSWPQSLRTTVSLVQASNSPISLSWGPGHVQIYNDGYWPICGAKHPSAMGQDFRECWASVFSVIGDAYAAAWSGRSMYLENMRMFLDRYGSLEETWFTFSFSPITDESGGVGGLFHPVTEVTNRMLSERRTKTLRDLASRAGKAKTLEEGLALSAQVLAESDLDLPFVLFYLLDAEAKQARLVGHSGVRPGDRAAPELVDMPTEGDRPWPLRQVVRTCMPVQIDGLPARLAGLTVGPYPEIPKSAFVMPLVRPGSERPVAVMVAGVSSRLPIDEPYRGFFDLVAGAVNAALANAHASEEERAKSEALKELDRAKTAFFSNVSHEFRTPLTLILGPLEDELAEHESPLPSDRHRRLETAYRNSLRLLKLVNTLLDFSRIEAGRAEASYEPTDLAADTAELASLFRSAIEKAGLVLTIDCDPLPEPIYVDRGMWEKIVLNLLSNALKHTFEGSITVGLLWRKDHCELTVTDTGIGIREQELPRLFERFHRVEGVKSRSHEGTGIGLALVQELVRLHGGTVGAESKEGLGSTFTVAIPSSHAHLPADRIVAEPTVHRTAARAAPFVEEALQWLPEAESSVRLELALKDAAAHGDGLMPHVTARPSVLWADDNADMREYVQRLLAKHYDVRAVRDGQSALAAARTERPDLVLTDVMMPGLDGYGLLRELRADPLTRSIPVIFLSARSGEEAVLAGLATGADDYIVKPFSAKELLARVRTHLELARSRREWSRKLESANKELEQFAYIASHDLQEPLRMIRSYVQLLEHEYKGKLDADADKYIHYAVDGANRMQALINDLLSLSRLNWQAKPAALIETNDVVDAALADLRLVVLESLAVVTKGALPALMADADQLRLVFQNLVANAIKFQRPGERPRVHVSSNRDGAGGWVFSVQDNGIGIESKHSERIFRLFQRLHNRVDYPGTGIGLTICRKVVERAGGTIWVESELGKGCTFRFTLPFAPSQAA
jgi:signal transduction histidine kinase